jgi:hypothetical protein
MARMFPERLPEQVESAAERRLFQELAEQLDNSYTVIYSAKWLAYVERGRARPGEADFVIAHPERGMLVMEVKGGGIGRDAAADRWYSVDRHGVRHAISDPVEQAKRNYYGLLDKLAAAPASRRWSRCCAQPGSCARRWRSVCAPKRPPSTSSLKSSSGCWTSWRVSSGR